MKLQKFVHRFEEIIIVSLIVFMVIVVALSTIELGLLLVADIVNPPGPLLEIEELLEIFGMFMLILIGLELLETIQTYYYENVIRVEIVVLVAMIAIARKIITMDYKKLTSITLLDMGLLMLALALGYFLLRKSNLIGIKKNPGKTSGDVNQATDTHNG
jgi:uncharacterized membrane protein (DUF373 family)